MTRDTHRHSVPDRARRRAIRAYAARLGVSYSVAARLLAAQKSRPSIGLPAEAPALGGDHRAWLFALRESRRFDQRVRDTRLAADLPMGRAAHLAERFPSPGGAHHATMLGLLYTVVVSESPSLVPAPTDLAWVAELGEEAAVDTVCTGVDRAARLLLDEDRWRLWVRVEAALASALAGADRRLRDAATELDGQFRSTVLRRSLDGARQTLDAVLSPDDAGRAAQGE
jgi:hypothetical protein